MVRKSAVGGFESSGMYPLNINKIKPKLGKLLTDLSLNISIFNFEVNRGEQLNLDNSDDDGDDDDDANYEKRENNNEIINSTEDTAILQTFENYDEVHNNENDQINNLKNKIITDYQTSNSSISIFPLKCIENTKIIAKVNICSNASQSSQSKNFQVDDSQSNSEILTQCVKKVISSKKKNKYGGKRRSRKEKSC